MRTLLTRVAALALLATVVACRTQPVLNLIDQPIPESARSLPDEEMERQIRLAGAELNWNFEKVAPRTLKGTLHVRTHTAVVNVVYNSKEYDITLDSSENLLQQPDGQIHRNYNKWVTNLRDNIQEKLQVAGLQKN